MKEEYGEDLNVIFVESQGTSPEATELFVYKHGWMGTGVRWTSERPARSGGRGLPNYILLDATGTVLMTGYTNRDKSKIKKAIEAEIKQAKELPAGLDKGFKKAWKALLADDFAKAHVAIEKAAAKGAEGSDSMRTRLKDRFSSRLGSIHAQIKNGHLIEALAAAEELSKSTKGHDEWHDAAEDAIAKLESDEYAAEMGAAKAFGKLYKKVLDDGIEKNLKKLNQFAEKHSGTKAGKRASRLASLAG